MTARTRITHGHTPEVLTQMALDAVEEGLARAGHSSNAVELADAEASTPSEFPQRVEDLPEAGHYTILAPGEKWHDEYKRCERHFRLHDERNLCFLGVLYCSTTHSLRVYDCRNRIEGIRIY